MSYGDSAEPLKCAACGAPFKGADIDRTMGIATCGSCGAVADLRRRMSELPQQPAAPTPRRQVPLPAKFNVTEQPGSMRIEWRWLGPSTFALLFFCLFWDGFLVFWYSAAFGTGELVMALFPLIHVAIGVGLTYVALAGLVNRTVIEVARSSLKISHGPLPWRGNGEHSREELSQLYVEEKITTGKNSRKVTYTLSAMLRDGKKRELLRGLDEKEQALYLEHAIESRFAIADVPVAGSVQ